MSFFEKINWTLVLGIFAGLIVIAAAFASWNQKKKDDRESALNKQKAENAQADMRALQVENLNKTNELANAYKKIISIQSKLINEVTGGDNKPFLMLTTTKLMLDSRSGKKYFILSFDVINKVIILCKMLKQQSMIFGVETALKMELNISEMEWLLDLWQ